MNQPPERFPADDPREWLRRARSDLLIANRPFPGIALEDHCYHAQQAAEKAIKAVLIDQKIAVPWTHNLVNLLSLLMPLKIRIPADVNEAKKLVRYNVARYPGSEEPVTTQEYSEAVRIAAAVVRWAAKTITSDSDGVEVKTVPSSKEQ